MLWEREFSKKIRRGGRIYFPVRGLTDQRSIKYQMILRRSLQEYVDVVSSWMYLSREYTLYKYTYMYIIHKNFEMNFLLSGLMWMKLRWPKPLKLHLARPRYKSASRHKIQKNTSQLNSQRYRNDQCHVYSAHSKKKSIIWNNEKNYLK